MRKIMSVLVFFFSVVFMFAEKSRVLVEQRVGPVGGELVSLGAPVIPAETESIVEYQFKVIGKTNEHATISCKIRFPNSFSVHALNVAGIQGIDNDGATIPAMAIYTTGGFKYAEFLLPQINDHVAKVSFKITVPKICRGASIPVSFNFDYMQKPFLKRYGTAIGIGCGIVAGVVVGVVTFNPVAGGAAGTAAGTGVASAVVGSSVALHCCLASASTIGTAAVASAAATGTGIATAAAVGAATAVGVGGLGTYISYAAVKDSLQEINEKYDSTPLLNSNSVFYWLVK